MQFMPSYYKSMNRECWHEYYAHKVTKLHKTNKAAILCRHIVYFLSTFNSYGFKKCLQAVITDDFIANFSHTLISFELSSRTVLSNCSMNLLSHTLCDSTRSLASYIIWKILDQLTQLTFLWSLTISWSLAYATFWIKRNKQLHRLQCHCVSMKKDSFCQDMSQIFLFRSRWSK